MENPDRDYHLDTWGIDIHNYDESGQRTGPIFELVQGSWGIDESDIRTNLTGKVLEAEALRFATAVDNARADLHTFMQQSGINPQYFAHKEAIAKGQELVKKYQLEQWFTPNFIARNPEVLGSRFLDPDDKGMALLDALAPGVAQQVRNRTAEIVELPAVAAE